MEDAAQPASLGPYMAGTTKTLPENRLTVVPVPVPDRVDLWYA
jgi:hypothetical protein